MLCFLPRGYPLREKLRPSADVYALAVSSWVALVGHEHRPEADEVHLLRHILDDRLPSLSASREVSAAVEAPFAR